MTDTEAKALALVNEVFMERCLVPDTYTNRAGNPYHEALCRAIERLEATEARHAAELREQAERFSEAASLALRMLTPYPLAKDEAEDILFPFIIAKPDPLVEALSEAMCGIEGEDYIKEAEALRTALAARGYEVRKIEHTQPAGGSDAE